MTTNIFNSDTYSENFMSAGNKAYSYNNLIEHPAMNSLVPDLKNKSVLDMGCGPGYNCVDFINRGAAKVVGIDISQKILDVAKAEKSHPHIQYLHLGVEKIDEIESKFDFIYCSLVMEYIDNFRDLLNKVHNPLNGGGIFLFSQEHPMGTAPLYGSKWIKDEQGIKISATISDYAKNGRRTDNWKNIGIPKYHRSFSFIINSLIESGFVILKIVEPSPTKQTLEIAPHLYDEIHRPASIVIKAQKP